MGIFDEALWQEGIDTNQLTVLSDRGGQMKGSRTKAHLIGKWELKLEFARPYTPDDNAWIETFIKYMKYHLECPESFETVQDVTDWVAKFQILYNDHPHSSLGYVRPNEEHEGLGNAIRQRRKENLLLARQKRHEFYRLQKTGVPGYGMSDNRGSEGLLCQTFEGGITENPGNGENDGFDGQGEGDFRTNSSTLLCQNR